MPQARRIKPKPKAKPKKAKVNRNIPWGLMLVILASGVVLGVLLNGARSDDSQFGAGLKALFKSNQNVSDAEDKAIEELIKNKSTEKEFDFYTVLPDIEQIMPDDLPGATPAPTSGNFDYYLQAASFTVVSEKDVPLEVDGEYVGRAEKVSFTSTGHKLKVLAPEEPVGGFTKVWMDWVQNLPRKIAGDRG